MDVMTIAAAIALGGFVVLWMMLVYIFAEAVKNDKAKRG